jgi:Uma2 family endonuclease
MAYLSFINDLLLAVNENYNDPLPSCQYLRYNGNRHIPNKWEVLIMGKKQVTKQQDKVKEQTQPYEPSNTGNPSCPILEERFEIINGIRYDFLSSPTVLHQVLVTELAFSIRQTCHREGIIVVAPMDVHLDENNIVQPDVIFISNETAHIVKNRKIYGAPDLVAEVLSPSTSANDKSRKKMQYERFGVKEYWIVDPHHHTIDQFVLVQEKLHLHATYVLGDILLSNQFPCISIDLALLFESIKRFELDED